MAITCVASGTLIITGSGVQALPTVTQSGFYLLDVDVVSASAHNTLTLVSNNATVFAGPLGQQDSTLITFPQGNGSTHVQMGPELCSQMFPGMNFTVNYSGSSIHLPWAIWQVTGGPVISGTLPVTQSGGSPVTTTGVISPNDPSVASGSQQQFTVTWNDQNGNPMSPQPNTTWSTGAPTTCSINVSGGLANALRIGQTSITAVSSDNSTTTTNNPGITITAAPQGGAFSFPNIPAGWTWTTNGISHKRNIAVGPGDGVNPAGSADWGDGASSPYPNETVITDSTAPFKGTLGKFGLTGNSPTCMQITYPAGLTQGNTPINEWIIGAFSSNKFTKMYCAFAVKIQSGFFFNQSGVQKFFYFNTTLVGGSNAVIILRGSDNGNGTYHMVYTTQAPGPQSANFQGTKALNTGQWYIMEAFVQMNNPGSSANAIVQLWITDPSTGITVQDINANTAQLTSITGDYFSQWSWAPYWGGNTNNPALPQTQFIYWNDFYTFAST